MKPIDQVIYDKVVSRKQELMKTSPAELRKLPLWTPEPFSACGKPQVFGVWHDTTAKGEDLFVTQCKRTIFLGYGHMFAEGFVLDTTEHTRDAEEELMWDYR
jgi:hypothetical protein